MPTTKELTEAKKASLMISSSLEILEDSSPDLKPLKEQSESVKQFITEHVDNFDSLSQEEIEPFRQSLTSLVDGLGKLPAQFENSEDKFKSAAAENIKQFTTPLSYLSENLKPKLTKEEVADAAAKENINNSLSGFDDKIAEFSKTKGLSQRQKGTVKDIKNRLTTLKEKLTDYFGEGKDITQFTSEKKEELSSSVNDLSNRMEELNKNSKIAQRLKNDNLFDTKFLHDIAENLAKVMPFKDGKKITVDEIADKSKDKINEAEDNIQNDVKESVKEDIKENIKEDVKEEVKQNINEEVKEEKKEEVKQEVTEENKKDKKTEPLYVKLEKSAEEKKDPEAKNATEEPQKTNVKLSDLVRIYKQIDDADSAFVRSSTEFRSAKSALKGAIKIYEDSIDPKNREASLEKLEKEGLSKDKQQLVNKKLREALDYTEIYVDKKGNEKNASDRAVNRYTVMSQVSESLKDQVDISDNSIGKKSYTNAEAADKLFEAAKKSYNVDMSKDEKARILATLRYAQQLKKNGDERFNLTKATKDIDDNTVIIKDKMKNYKKVDDKSKSIKERVKKPEIKPQPAPTV